MSKKDYIKDWFSELPEEQASPGFSAAVMQKVMSEWRLNPQKYQPIIGKKTWWMIALLAFVLTGILFSLQSSMPDSSYLESTSNGFISRALVTFGGYFDKLNNISPAVAIGTLAIIALWFFDQLFSMAVRR